MDAKNFQKWLVQHHACSVAVTWVRKHGYGLAAAWEACERADWMLWLAAHVGVDLRLIVRVGCACARTALPFVPADEPAPRIAIETAERWTRGEATREEVRAAGYAAGACNADYAEAAAAAADAAALAAKAAHAAKGATPAAAAAAAAADAAALAAKAAHAAKGAIYAAVADRAAYAAAKAAAADADRAAYGAYDAVHAAALAAALREMAALVRQIIPAAVVAAAAQQSD